MTQAAVYYTGLVDKYRDRLPLDKDTPAVSLCEGATPLIPLPMLVEELNPEVRLFAKFDGANPTGS